MRNLEVSRSPSGRRPALFFLYLWMIQNSLTWTLPMGHTQNVSKNISKKNKHLPKKAPQKKNLRFNLFRPCVFYLQNTAKTKPAKTPPEPHVACGLFQESTMELNLPEPIGRSISFKAFSKRLETGPRRAFLHSPFRWFGQNTVGDKIRKRFVGSLDVSLVERFVWLEWLVDLLMCWEDYQHLPVGVPIQP